MRKTQKIILSIFGFFAISAITYAAFTTYTGKNSDAGSTNNDIWTFTVSKLNINNKEENKSNYKGEIEGSINSTLFGDFALNTKLTLTDNGTKECDDGKKTYQISGNIKSIYFGDMQSKNSYYCPYKPVGDNIKLIFYSEQLGYKQVSGDLSKTVIENIFDKQQVAIIGTTNINGELSGLESEDGNVEINTIDASNIAKSTIWANINENIENVTRNLTANSETTFSKTDGTNLQGGKYFYYNYDGEKGKDNYYGNEGKNLEIGTSSFSDANPLNYITDFDGNSTIIVKGGNVYINSDLVNSRGLTTIIAKRNGNNGGNIYVDPDVTNIDAILIAEGSLLSYQNNKVLNRNDTYTDNSLLSRQLYIYGSLFTKNVIGSEKIPYGSDAYIGNKTFKDKDDNIYNLANMRKFQLRYASDDISESKCGGALKTLFTPGYSSSANLDSIKYYAFAGKMKCFNPKLNKNIPNNNNYKVVSTPISKLRTTGRKESIVIEYNPKIQSEVPYILKKNR